MMNFRNQKRSWSGLRWRFLQKRKLVGLFSALVMVVQFNGYAAYSRITKPAPGKTLKENDVVDYRKCQMDRKACICAPGLLPQTFFGPKGVRFYQCLKANCGPGEQVQISRSAGGKRTATCKKIAIREYAEPKVIKQSVQSAAPKKRGK